MKPRNVHVEFLRCDDVFDGEGCKAITVAIEIRVLFRRNVRVGNVL